MKYDVKRPGGKYQVGDRFVVKTTYKDFNRGDVVEIVKNLGKDRRRTIVRARNDNGVILTFKVTLLGKRVR